MADAVPAGWEDILDPGERILWQGRPVPRFDWSALLAKDSLSGLFLSLFALFWISQAFWMTRANAASGVIDSLFPLFGIPFLLIGLKKLIGAPLRSFQLLKSSHYTLTDRNAFIASSRAGQRHLQRFPLGGALQPALEDGSGAFAADAAGALGSVWFASGLSLGGAEHQRGWFGQGAGGSYASSPVLTNRIGFQSIPDARKVYRLLLDAQTALAKAAAAPPATPPASAVTPNPAPDAPPNPAADP